MPWDIHRLSARKATALSKCPWVTGRWVPLRHTCSEDRPPRLQKSPRRHPHCCQWPQPQRMTSAGPAGRLLAHDFIVQMGTTMTRMTVHAAAAIRAAILQTLALRNSASLRFRRES